MMFKRGFLVEAGELDTAVRTAMIIEHPYISGCEPLRRSIPDLWRCVVVAVAEWNDQGESKTALPTAERLMIPLLPQHVLGPSDLPSRAHVVSIAHLPSHPGHYQIHR